MAKTDSTQQSLYEQIADGKRLVSVPAARLAALKIWLWRNGYTWKTNTNGQVCNVLINEKG